MINKLLDSLNSGESMTLDLSKDDKGRACIILGAAVDLDPDDSDETRRQLRAAIAQPLVLRLDDGDGGDEQLAAAISTYAAEQRDTRSSLANYKASMASNRASAEVASSQSANAKDDSKSGKASKMSSKAAAATAVDSAPAQEALSSDDASQEATNPGSLF